MEKKSKPGYYAIIPAEVRYDTALSANAKLLYGEITALANSRGFCSASNNYFAELYSVNKTTISEWIAMLAQAGYIDIEIDHQGGNQRKIRIGIREKPKTYSGKAEDPYSGKAEDNNTSINNTYNKGPAASPQLRDIYQLYLTRFIIPIRLRNKFDISDPNEKKKAIAAAEARYKLTPKRRDAIMRRLKDAGFDMLRAAIVGYSREAWYIGENDREWVADLEAFICRSYENVEKGAALYESQRRK